MSSQKMKPGFFYPDTNFTGITDKERLAREEIGWVEERLTECGFSISQIHQYKAEIWDLSEDLSDSEIDERETKTVGDYCNFLQCSGGLTLVLYRQCLLSFPSQISAKEVLKYERTLESLALLKLISNKMSQTRFELVQSTLHSMEPEAEYAREQSKAHIKGGILRHADTTEIKDGLIKDDWTLWQTGKLYFDNTNRFAEYVMKKYDFPAKRSTVRRWNKKWRMERKKC